MERAVDPPFTIQSPCRGQLPTHRTTGLQGCTEMATTSHSLATECPESSLWCATRRASLRTESNHCGDRYCASSTATTDAYQDPIPSLETSIHKTIGSSTATCLRPSFHWSPSSDSAQATGCPGNQVGSAFQMHFKHH
jgi:hypothetical protein